MVIFLKRDPIISIWALKCTLNPFITDIRLQITDDRYKEIESIRIFDISGKEVIAYAEKDKAGGIKIDTGDLPCGVYFIKVKAGNATLIKKVVKIR